MVEGGCGKCIQYLMFTFNLLFWLAGCGILGVGIWLRVTQGDFATLVPSIPFVTAPNLCIIAGVIVMVVGFIGCCGALKENKCLLLTLGTPVTLVVFVPIFIQIFILIPKEYCLLLRLCDSFMLQHVVLLCPQLEKFAREDLTRGMNQYGMTGQSGLTRAWDLFQTEKHCCGVNNSTDWFNRPVWPNQSWVPDSCCKPVYRADDCGQSGDVLNFFEDGCVSALKTDFMFNLGLIGGIGIGIGLIQILGMVFSLCLFYRIRNEGTYA
ncbi:tetraspanin-4-like [Branchiostoma floridae]|uniref:Tetraspanin n=1 Tax=Branchiostoma floridae TaxID=7739 RepID=A0A9J7MN82_BRAFL|nr:tetraspanin-4-like [Branchiostoma floridae]